ncbi:hypothetical protein E2C01_095580 [Portunus trituberculatus]|uniref:Uncharacterized protein n=1 Tax=Portunus trituberculatus TaxID=210409 RepID=A0A5B7K4E5_PORTR|nr:hypothetical protein [Portunus trituberculatus]
MIATPTWPPTTTPPHLGHAGGRRQGGGGEGGSGGIRMEWRPGEEGWGGVWYIVHVNNQERGAWLNPSPSYFQGVPLVKTCRVSSSWPAPGGPTASKVRLWAGPPPPGNITRAPRSLSTMQLLTPL